MNIKIYICHYPPLLDRKKYLDVAIPELNIPFEFCSQFNRENIEKYEHCFTNSPDVLKFKEWHESPPCMSASIKATTIEHAKIYEKIVNSDDVYSVILEDDAVLGPDFKERLLKMLEVLPENWDVVHFSNGCGGRPSLHCTDGTNLIKMEGRTSWTASGYLINKQTAKKFIEYIYPIALPIDFELNFIQRYLQMNVYWAAEPLVYEGSNPAAGDRHNYTTSQIR
jgi:GR25 family glycosyltransferase involved in LPS biosynthesis